MRHIVNRLRNQSGVTIIDMLIVVAVIGILTAMAVPNLTGFLFNSEQKSAVSDKSSLQSSVDGYRSANPNKLPVVIETGDTITTSATSISACPGTSAGAINTAIPKNNCFIDMAELAEAGFISKPTSVASASGDNVVGGTGLYSWSILANGEVAAFEKATGMRIVFISSSTPTPTEEIGF